MLRRCWSKIITDAACPLPQVLVHIIADYMSTERELYYEDRVELDFMCYTPIAWNRKYVLLKDDDAAFFALDLNEDSVKSIENPNMKFYPFENKEACSCSLGAHICVHFESEVMDEEHNLVEFVNRHQNRRQEALVLHVLPFTRSAVGYDCGLPYVLFHGVAYDNHTHFFSFATED